MCSREIKVSQCKYWPPLHTSARRVYKKLAPYSGLLFGGENAAIHSASHSFESSFEHVTSQTCEPHSFLSPRRFCFYLCPDSPQLLLYGERVLAKGILSAPMITSTMPFGATRSQITRQLSQTYAQKFWISKTSQAVSLTPRP